MSNSDSEKPNRVNILLKLAECVSDASVSKSDINDAILLGNEIAATIQSTTSAVVGWKSTNEKFFEFISDVETGPKLIELVCKRLVWEKKKKFIQDHTKSVH